MGIGSFDPEEHSSSSNNGSSSGSADFSSKQEEYCHLLDTFEPTLGAEKTTCPSCHGGVGRVARVNESIETEEVVIRYDKLSDFNPADEEVTVGITTIKNRRITGEGNIVLLFECMEEDCGQGYEVEFTPTERRKVDSSDSPYLSENE
jgi:hypothetical protein